MNLFQLRFALSHFAIDYKSGENWYLIKDEKLFNAYNQYLIDLSGFDGE